MYETFEDRTRALLDSYISDLAYLRDDPALTPMEMSERDFIEYEKNRPMPGTVVDPQKLDLMEYMRNETEDTGDATYEPIDRLKFLMGPQSPLASAVQPEYYRDPRTGQLMSTIPSGPNTPLPTPGWNPSMIKPPGDPKYRPPAQDYYIGPRGEKIPFV